MRAWVAGVRCLRKTDDIRYKMFGPRQRNNAILILCMQMERYPINDVVVYGL